MNKNIDNIVEWDIKVPIFRNSLILKQLGIAIGIPFGILILFLLSQSAFYGLVLVLGLLVLSTILVLIIFRGGYHVHYVIDKNGILSYSDDSQAKRVNKVGKLTLILGLVSRNPSAMGASMLSQSKIKVYLKWNKIKKVKYNPRQYSIILKESPTNLIAVFCNKENYTSIEEAIKKRLTI